jgi:hypothetical protein
MQGPPLFGDVGAISGGIVGVNNELQKEIEITFWLLSGLACVYSLKSILCRYALP